MNGRNEKVMNELSDEKSRYVSLFGSYEFKTTVTMVIKVIKITQYHLALLKNEPSISFARLKNRFYTELRS